MMSEIDELSQHAAELNIRIERAEAEIADLRQQLATITALVPEAGLLEVAAAGSRMEVPHVSEKLKQLAAAIRDWRGEQEGEESDDRDRRTISRSP